MANPKDEERDVRTQMSVALFWRGLIGDLEYVKFEPDDMLRWYDALELRGPDEIRDLLTERYSTRPMPTIHGVVSLAPHPPTWLVREWLASHEHKTYTSGYWWGAIGFTLVCFLTVPFIHGCMDLQPLNPLVMNPPSSAPQVANTAQAPAFGSSPGMAPPPVAVLTPTATGPASTGIAGGASGAVPASGATGPTNGGASAGVTSGGGPP